MRERGIRELLVDPGQTQDLRWTRRRLLGAGLLAGAFARGMPAGWVPVAALAAQPDALIAEQAGLRVLNDRPLNAETPAHLLDDMITPAARLFVRNNGLPPSLGNTTPQQWRLEITGEACEHPRTFSIVELRREFSSHTYQLQLECGGNGRAEFRPRVPGNQWTTGAVGCPQWTGVRLRDVLQACGVRGNAVYVGYKAADTHLSGDPNKDVISRGVPLAKAMEDESLIAYAMNGEPIPPLHGAPLRLVCGGWPASVSGKWLTQLLVRDRVHDGAKMTGSSYRVPCTPVAPGQPVADADMCIIESMPVKSLVTFPQSGARVASGAPVTVRGHAWAGDLAVRRVSVSVDFGATWLPARLERPANRLAWQHWQTQVRLPLPGYHEIWARATDATGRSQPMLVPGWNPKGYLNNAAHRIALAAT